MRLTGLIANREYQQIIRTRGFLITLFFLPIAFLTLSLVGSGAIGNRIERAIVVEDAEGLRGAQLNQRLELDHQRTVMTEWARYFARWRGATPAPSRPWSNGVRWFTDAEVRAFAAKGGVATAQHETGRDFAPGRPFRSPAQRYIVVREIPIPKGRAANEEAVRLFSRRVATPEGPRDLALFLHIPAALQAGQERASVWTASPVDPYLINLLAETLRDTPLPARPLEQIHSGSDPFALYAAPSTGANYSAIVPTAFAYLLLITILVSGSMLLQSVSEERTTKLVDALLACASPEEIMRGKLIGCCAAGLTTIISWLTVASVAGLTGLKATGSAIFAGIANVSLPIIILAAFYYISGYMIIAMVYLALGASGKTPRQSQSYSAVASMCFTIPFMVLLPASLINPAGPIPTIMSWIPIYTPFAMLTRIGSGLPAWEIARSIALIVVFITIEFIVIGAWFRARLTGERMVFPGLRR